jgi:hypothetical protein
MWRLVILSMGLFSLVLAACDQDLVGNDGMGNGDYEVVALTAE